LLLGKLLPGLGELLLLVGHLLLENVALAFLRGRARRRGLLGETVGGAIRDPRRKLCGRHDVDLAGDQLAFLAGGVLLVARIERPAAGVHALVDSSDLGERQPGNRRRDPEAQRNQSPKRTHETDSLAQKKKGRMVTPPLPKRLKSLNY